MHSIIELEFSRPVERIFTYVVVTFSNKTSIFSILDFIFLNTTTAFFFYFGFQPIYFIQPLLEFIYSAFSIFRFSFRYVMSENSTINKLPINENTICNSKLSSMTYCHIIRRVFKSNKPSLLNRTVYICSNYRRHLKMRANFFIL